MANSRIKDLTVDVEKAHENHYLVVDKEGDSSASKMLLSKIVPCRLEAIPIGSWNMHANRYKNIIIDNSDPIIGIFGVSINDDDGSVNFGASMYDKLFASMYSNGMPFASDKYVNLEPCPILNFGVRCHIVGNEIKLMHTSPAYDATGSYEFSEAWEDGEGSMPEQIEVYANELDEYMIKYQKGTAYYFNRGYILVGRAFAED